MGFFDCVIASLRDAVTPLRMTLFGEECLMKKIGVLFGMENTFPPALVEKINGMKVDGVTAEFVKLGGVKMADPSGYAVIIDRISQDIPFYRAYLKNAALTGTIVVNNPFWWTADDKFFNYALGDQAGCGHSCRR